MFGRKMDPCEYNGIWADKLEEKDIVVISAEKGGKPLQTEDRSGEDRTE